MKNLIFFASILLLCHCREIPFTDEDTQAPPAKPKVKVTEETVEPDNLQTETEPPMLKSNSDISIITENTEKKKEELPATEELPPEEPPFTAGEITLISEDLELTERRKQGDKKMTAFSPSKTLNIKSNFFGLTLDDLLGLMVFYTFFQLVFSLAGLEIVSIILTFITALLLKALVSLGEWSVESFWAYPSLLALSPRSSLHYKLIEKSQALKCFLPFSRFGAPLFLKETISDLVFTDKNGELLKYNAIQLSFNVGFEALGLPWHSTHICRHTFATVALMTTKNLSAVQASLGHTEQRTTQRYAKTVVLLSSETGEKTFSALFKKSRL